MKFINKLSQEIEKNMLDYFGHERRVFLNFFKLIYL